MVIPRKVRAQLLYPYCEVLIRTIVYSVVLDVTRNQACSGSMDSTVRIWNLNNGQCIHTLSGHTSLVGLLGLSSSYLVSAAADSTLRIWDPVTCEHKHTLAAHTGAITCFQHDEFKVLSGSDGTLKMWDIRDGSPIRDLLTGITGVWQVVFEGRWCVAASNIANVTVLDVWDFEDDEDWIREPATGYYDQTSDEEDELDQADADAMDQDLEVLPNEFEGDFYPDFSPNYTESKEEVDTDSSSLPNDPPRWGMFSSSIPEDSVSGGPSYGGVSGSHNPNNIDMPAGWIIDDQESVNPQTPVRQQRSTNSLRRR